MGTLIVGSGINSSESIKIKDAYIKITSPKSVEGYTQGGDFCGTATNYKIFFAANLVMMQSNAVHGKTKKFPKKN